MMSYLGNGITFPIAYAGAVKSSGIVFPVIGIILLLLRGLVLSSKRLRPGLAESFSMFSSLTLLGMGEVFVWSADRGGLSWPTPDAPQLTEYYISPFERLIAFNEYLFLPLMVVTLGTTKLSIVFFFRKLFAHGHRTIWNHLSMALAVIVAIWTVAFTLSYLLVCGNDAVTFWSPEDIRLKKCLQVTGGEAVFEKAAFGSDLFLDIACILLPFPTLSILAVFMVGIMTILASIARLVIWIEILNTATHDGNEDINLAITLALYWSMVEAGLGFIACQLPALAAYSSRSTPNDLAKIVREGGSVVSLRSRDSRNGNDANENGTDIELSRITEHEAGSKAASEVDG